MRARTSGRLQMNRNPSASSAKKRPRLLALGGGLRPRYEHHDERGGDEEARSVDP